jgi:hypothetical protein
MVSANALPPFPKNRHILLVYHSLPKNGMGKPDFSSIFYGSGRPGIQVREKRDAESPVSASLPGGPGPAAWPVPGGGGSPGGAFEATFPTSGVAPAFMSVREGTQKRWVLPRSLNKQPGLRRAQSSPTKPPSESQVTCSGSGRAGARFLAGPPWDESPGGAFEATFPTSEVAPAFMSVRRGPQRRWVLPRSLNKQPGLRGAQSSPTKPPSESQVTCSGSGAQPGDSEDLFSRTRKERGTMFGLAQRFSRTRPRGYPAHGLKEEAGRGR